MHVNIFIHQIKLVIEVSAPAAKAFLQPALYIRSSQNCPENWDIKAPAYGKFARNERNGGAGIDYNELSEEFLL